VLRQACMQYIEKQGQVNLRQITDFTARKKFAKVGGSPRARDLMMW